MVGMLWRFTEPQKREIYENGAEEFPFIDSDKERKNIEMHFSKKLKNNI